MVLPQIIGNVGNERHKAGTFDCPRKLALKLRAGSGDTARKDFPLFVDIPLQGFYVFVVDVFDTCLFERTFSPASLLRLGGDVANNQLLSLTGLTGARARWHVIFVSGRSVSGPALLADFCSFRPGYR